MKDQHTSTGNPTIDAAIRTGKPLSIETTMDGAGFSEKDLQYAALFAVERAIVEAADKWRGPLPMEQDEIAAHELVDAVDAWRKLKGKG